MKLFLAVLLSGLVVLCVARAAWTQEQIYPGGEMAEANPIPYPGPVYVNPALNGGYVVTQPSTQPFQPPIYINPALNGGAVITQPGVGLPVLPTNPVVPRVPGYR